MLPLIGSHVELIGRMYNDPVFGQTFEFDEYKVIDDSNIEAVTSLLKLLPGVGAKTAAAITEAFGEQAIEIIVNDPEKLKEIDGIGEKKAKKIVEEAEKILKLKQTMHSLGIVGIPLLDALRIAVSLTPEQARLLASNPYYIFKHMESVRSNDIRRLDKILGKALAPSTRFKGLCIARAIMDYKAGDTVSYKDKLLSGVGWIMSRNGDNTKEESKNVIEALDSLMDSGELIELDAGAVQLSFAYEEENYVAQKLAVMSAKQPSKTIQLADIEKEIEIMNLKLEPEQREAVLNIRKPISVITGGPGTGKSYTVSAIASIAHKLGLSVAVLTPTGKAAERILKLGTFAQTIHAAIGWGSADIGKKPLNKDLIILDEASMIDIEVMYHFFRSVKENTHIVIVGDAQQLPPVGPGEPFREIVDSAMLPTVVLKTNKRQGEGSAIIYNAQRVLAGKMIKPDGKEVVFKRCDTEKEVTEVLNQYIENMTAKRGVKAFENAVIAIPVRFGNGDAVGTSEINKQIRKLIFGDKAQSQFVVGDKVVQTVNNYDKNVYNGELGIVTRCTSEGILVKFGDREIIYSGIEVGELEYAYAMTVHKLQGSELDYVILPIYYSQMHMLDKRLLYTAITRAKKRIVIISNPQWLYMALNAKERRRNTHFKAKLEKAFGKPKSLRAKIVMV